MTHFTFTREEGDEAFTMDVDERTTKTWSLVVRSTAGGITGWAKVFIDSSGALAIISDYGNYAYHWTSWGERDFREFLLGIDDDYLGGKLAMDRRSGERSKELDVKRTLDHIKRRILHLRRSRAWDPMTARDEWENMGLLEDGFVDEWMKNTALVNAWEHLVYLSVPRQLSMFLRRIWPLVKMAIRYEMADEKDRENRRETEQKHGKPKTSWAFEVASTYVGRFGDRAMHRGVCRGRTAFEARDDALQAALRSGVVGSIDTVTLRPLDPIPFGKADGKQ